VRPLLGADIAQGDSCDPRAIDGEGEPAAPDALARPGPDYNRALANAPEPRRLPLPSPPMTTIAGGPSA